MARTSLPPGFRFHPTDVELIMYYLKRKVMGKKLHFEAIAEVNIYKFSPWDLPDKSCLKSKDLEWFFFCPREKKYASGIRVKRATENGYWKTTGKDRLISHKDQTVGSLKTLIFHLGHAPKGERTDWVIHEYKILDDQLAAAGVQDTYVICKLFKKHGLGPKNGAQYGAPFNEADWADDDDTQNLPISFASDGLSASTQMQPETQSCALARGTLNPRSTSALPENEEGPSPSAGQPTSEVLVHQTEDEIDRLLASFTEENTKLLISENGISQDDLSGKGKNKDLACSDGYDIYSGLGDLGSWGEMDEGRLDLSTMQKDCYSLDKILPQDNSAYIELDDLLVPLDCSDEDTGTDKSLVGDIVGSYIHDYRQNFCAGSSFAAMNHYSSCANQLSLMPEGFYDGDHSVNVLQMADNQLYQGNVEYGMDVLLGQPDNGLNSNQDMERGAHKIICLSRIMESIPAHHRSPTAAEHLKAHSFSTCGGGSSIHIKAEVTHGAGECTNEALSVMVGESSSCWCNLFQNMLLLVWNYLLYLIVCGFHVVLFCFYLNDNLYFFHRVITIFIHLKSVSSSSAQNFPLFPKNKLGFLSL